MFEFESRGTLEDLRLLEAELLEHLGYGSRDSFPQLAYTDVATRYGVEDVSRVEEARMLEDDGRVAFLQHFPESTSPFWNMKRDHQGRAHKIDVIIDGMETIGSAERSTNPEDMRERFYTISEGQYAGKLFKLFGQERVERELNDFLKLDFFPRYGAGIGMTRLVQSMAKN